MIRYRIGQFSLISRLPVKTLRYYHEIGLLEPEFVDHQSGYRFYAPGQLETARLIRLLRSLEFPLDAVRDAMTRVEAGEEITEVVAGQQAAIRDRLHELLALEKKLAGLQVSAPRAGAVAFRRLEPELTAAIRFSGRYAEVGNWFGELMGKVADIAAGTPGALYWQSEYHEADADISVSVPVSRPVERDGVDVFLLDPVDACTTVYQGPYEGISVGYERVLSEVGRRAGQIVLPIRERYLRGPGDASAPNPDEFFTEIVVPFTASARSPEPSG